LPLNLGLALRRLARRLGLRKQAEQIIPTRTLTWPVDPTDPPGFQRC